MPSVTPNYGLYQPDVNNPDDQDLWGGYLNDNMSVIDTTMKANADAIAALQTVPVGAGMDYWGTSAPANYLFAYGQAIDRTTYAALFALFGTTYGAGDGSTTFNIPDKRGRSSFGKDNMGGSSANRLTKPVSQGITGSTLGGTGGEQTHTMTTSEMPAHAHTVTNGVATPGGLAGGGSFGAVAPIPTGNTGGGAAFNVVPPGIVCNYIIRVL